MKAVHTNPPGTEVDKILTNYHCSIVHAKRLHRANRVFFTTYSGISRNYSSKFKDLLMACGVKIEVHGSRDVNAVLYELVIPLPTVSSARGHG